MKGYFLYELKKAVLPTSVFALISVAVFVFNSVYEATHGASYPLLNVPSITLAILCTVVPVLTYAFKNNRRYIDLLYSFPLRREKLYLAKTLVGLIETFVPFTLAYAVGVPVIASVGQNFHTAFYALYFFVALVMGLALFGINAFAFTRANGTADGIAFMVFFSCALAALATYVCMLVGKAGGELPMDGSFWFTYSPLTVCAVVGNSLVRSGAVPNAAFASSWVMLVIYLLVGVACWVGTFALLGRTPAENAGRISSSLFGYRTFIPFYVALGIALLAAVSVMAVFYVFTAAAGALTYFLYRRTFRLPLSDWLTLLGAVVAGFLLAIPFFLLG